MADPLDLPSIPAGLRDALRHSPDNVPLLLHAADTVLRAGGFADAEVLFKRALALAPGSADAKLGLATAFHLLGKRSEALVLVETLTSGDDAPGGALILHARLALEAGEPRLAARLYARVLAREPRLANAELEAHLRDHMPREPGKAQEPAPGPAWTSSSGNEDDAEDDDAGEPQGMPAGELDEDAPVEIERPSLRFADVGGMDAVKDEIRMKIILPLQKPELFQAYGKKVGGGILLYGPPGCGKTFLARATAGEVNASFIAVGISDVLDMWIGRSERNLHAIFENARGHRPCVLFFDEVDALGANRTDMLKTGGRHLINQFLSEFDGVQASNEGVLILAATNAPWHLDPAFRRPGRFDRILFVPPPDAAARAAILKLLLRDKPAESIDCEQLAKKADGFSGADLKGVVDVAVEEKLRAAMRSGSIQPLSTRDLLDAIKKHRPTARDWFETARNYALYANQSGLYDDVLAHLGMKKR